MRYLFIFSWSILVLFSCSSQDSSSEKAAGNNQAQEIVDKAIAAHGGEKFEALNLTFDFRGRHYTAVRNKGLFTYTRSFTDSTGRVVDILTNNGFTRKVNGKTINLPEERKQAFSQSVNSVIYFALLPFGLNDPAVQKQYLGQVQIRQQPYHKIKVTFAQEGGGTDYEDEFIYWINQNNFRVDYLAYSFHTDGGGLRFREAFKTQVVGGIRFQQYINYEPLQKQVKLPDLDKLFEAGQLKELSRIELENIRVNK